jgi:cation diffusion facilitator CzcD-associated flavoprotein CzcO
MTHTPIVIVGAGPAGIAAAVSLRDRSLNSVIVDRADQVATSWRGRYEKLKLNTSKYFSHLPRRRYPPGTPMFPTRSEVADYFERHARQSGIALQLSTNVMRIDPEPNGWRLATSSGDMRANHVVVATGFENTPHIPEWPGMGGFTGELLHSSAYHNPAPYEGKRILVVGSGSSGMEIAHDLAAGGADRVWLAVRTPPNILTRAGPGGIPGDLMAIALYHAPVGVGDAIARFVQRRTIGDLTEFGLPMPDEGLFTRARRNLAPTIVDMDVITAVRDRSVHVVKTIDSFDHNTVSLVDGTRLQPDAVICATGYLRGLEALVGHLDVLNDDGIPRVLAPMPAARGLWFTGFLARPALIGYIAKQSRPLAKQIAAVADG